VTFDPIFNGVTSEIRLCMNPPGQRAVNDIEGSSSHSLNRGDPESDESIGLASNDVRVPSAGFYCVWNHYV